MPINVLRCALVASSLIGAMLAGAASAQGRPGVYLKAEQCLRSNVDRVVAAEPNLQSAADFLINYACVEQVARVTKYELNQAIVRMFSNTAFSGFTGPIAPGKPPPPKFEAKVDPETGDVILPPEKPGEPPNVMASMFRAQAGTMAMQSTQMVSADLRKLAGELVLAARERQLSKPR